ncbi:MAG: glutamyl-tRNA reductase [Eubacterium aggregans]|uniref:glutamyl-tRNA reductase n=1 Tax=Eubacterium aggregans TaxID=81409 RepID=UPI002B2084F6|nr:glutamyl-tRNA reductase [Eubacterium aggregans]MEA5074433.1 glutamyl-tRNA reductase [Eubacterium aggregans]
MKIVVVGINHKNTPLNIREKGSFMTRTLKEGIEALKQEESIAEVLILSTCNRSEIYAATRNPEAALAALKDYYLKAKSPELEDYLFSYREREAMLHLYRVVTGLDSMILGEDQILGQVKDALEKAQSVGGTGKYLTKIFREAVTFAKKVKTVYKISETPVSLSSTAVKHIKRTYANYADKRVLIIGSGKMGILALRYMAAEGFHSVYMTNRTYHPGDEYRGIYKGVNVLQYDDRYTAIEEMDVVISATASPHVVLKEELMAQRKKPLMIIDMALPRDVEPAIGEMPDVALITVDDFKHIIDEKMHYREKIAAKIEGEIDSEIDGLMVWITKSKVDNMVAHFNNHAGELADETIEILNGRLKLTDKEEEFLSKIVRSKFREMVMPSIRQLKTLDNEDDILRFEKTIAFLTQEGQ